MATYTGGYHVYYSVFETSKNGEREREKEKGGGVNYSTATLIYRPFITIFKSRVDKSKFQIHAETIR